MSFASKLSCTLLILLESVVFAADINFHLNSSTVQGIVDSTSAVNLRGTVTQWETGTNMINYGGDYWSIILQLDPGTYQYKYGAHILNLDGTISDYWENEIPGADYQGDNRMLIVGTEDMVIDLDYLGRGPDNNNPPYNPSESIDVFFRVNMSQHTNFNPSIQSVYIAGAFQDWNPGSSQLTREGESDYWNIALQMDAGDYGYKYTLGAWDGTDESSNRSVTINQDTTIQWVYWNDVGPEPFISNTILSSLTFATDVSNAVASNGFVMGDTLLVKWGYGGTQTTFKVDTLTADGFGSGYSVSITDVSVDFDLGIYYQYYRIKNEDEYREVYFNFDYDGSDNSIAERRFRGFEGVDDGGFAIFNDDKNSNVNAQRMPIFRNADPIESALTVTYTVDLRPAYYQVLYGDTLFDIQGGLDVKVADSVFAWGIWMNGPATKPAGESWTSWGSTLYNTQAKKMWDDGTNGDAISNDSIYSVQFTYNADDPIGQEFKFGIKGGDNESGYGLNHIENIDIDNPTVVSYWGSINPFFYDAWDYDNYIPSLAIKYINGLSPNQFSLGNNYPNPFNPSTSFEFTIPQGTEVTLAVYDINGRLISSIYNAYTMSGTYQTTWNGLTVSGIPAPSGMYFYILNAEPNIKQVRKMMLIK